MPPSPLPQRFIEHRSARKYIADNNAAMRSDVAVYNP